MIPKDLDEASLIKGVISGDLSAQRKFLTRFGPVIWESVEAVVQNSAASREAYEAVIGRLAANGFARLQGYKAGTSLKIFLVLETKEILAEDTVQVMRSDRDAGWRRFEMIFARDMDRLAAKAFPFMDKPRREDILQDVREQLMRENFRALSQYSGRGSFVGFVCTVITNILTDLRRREAGRLRLPEGVARMPALHQAIYKASVWRGVAFEPNALKQVVKDPPATLEEISAAMPDVASAVVKAQSAPPRAREVSLDGAEGHAAVAGPGDPELDLVALDEETRFEQLRLAVLRRAEQLPVPEKAYLQVVLNANGAPKPQEIARVLGVGAPEIYRMRRRALQWLEKVGGDVVKTTGASV